MRTKKALPLRCFFRTHGGQQEPIDRPHTSHKLRYLSSVTTGGSWPVHGLWYRWNAGVILCVHLAHYPRPPMPECDMLRPPVKGAARRCVTGCAHPGQETGACSSAYIGGRGGCAVNLRFRFRDLSQDASSIGEFSTPHAPWEISAVQSPRDVL